jgi:hypothetical protein
MTDSGPQQDVIGDVGRFIRCYCVLPDAAYLPLAVWVIATYIPDSFDAFPYVSLLSPAKRCGKTRVLEVLELLCFKPWRGTSPTCAALFRMMEDMPTLLLDEVEVLGNRKPSENTQAISAILNAGHRKGATVPRCDGPDNEVRHFPVYGPKAFAAIGRLPDTLGDRCIRITMQRRTISQDIERFLLSRAKAQAKPLAVSLTKWVKEKQKSVQSKYDGLDDLPFLSDRDADLWMPLFAVCAVGAPERTEELKKSALVLSGAKAADDVEDSQALKLLADVRRVWMDGEAHMLTASLLDELKSIPDSPWGESGRELTPRGLAAILRPFGPEPRQVRVNGATTGKGYLRSEFEDAFLRYLPSVASDSETRETTRPNTGENADFGRETRGPVSD